MLEQHSHLLPTAVRSLGKAREKQARSAPKGSVLLDEARKVLGL